LNSNSKHNYIVLNLYITKEYEIKKGSPIGKPLYLDYDASSQPTEFTRQEHDDDDVRRFQS
jgi:hypothetical protein